MNGERITSGRYGECVSRPTPWLPLTLVPAIVLWIRNGVVGLRRASLQRYAEASLINVRPVNCPASWFLAGNTPVQTRCRPLVYMLLPFFLWAAMRFGPGGVSTSLLVVALLSTWGATQGRGPFATSSSDQNVLSLQLFLIAISLPLTFLAALVEERRESEQNFRGLVETTAAVPWRSISTLGFHLCRPTSREAPRLPDRTMV